MERHDNTNCSCFRLRMAVAKAGWSTTRKVSQDIVYTHNWAIEDFDFTMGVVADGKIESGVFCIAGVPGEFHLVVERKLEKFPRGGHTYSEMPTRLQVNDQELEAKYFFSVALLHQGAAKGSWTKAAGKLEVLKEGTETQLGEFGDSAKPTFVLSYDFKFRPKSAIKYHDGQTFHDTQKGFFTTGSTCLLNMMVTLTIPGKLANLVRGAGGEDMKEMRENSLLDFQPFLSEPKHSDILLNCGGKKFLCHKVILAAR